MNIKKKQEGFTIIEVMIVLAIAGLIIVVALIAIPQLQRNQRNNARQSLMSRISTEVGNYAGNNNGRIPSDADELQSMYERYLADIDLGDPRTGVNTPVIMGADTAGSVPDLSDVPAELTAGTDTDGDGTIDTAPTVTGGGDLGVAYYQDGMTCNGEQLVAGAAREFALYAVLEGGSVYCLDNS